MSIGSRIKANRLQRGWTQSQLAEAVGVPQGVIANYENNARTPSAPKLAVFARVFSLPLEELIDPVEAPSHEAATEDRRVHGNSTAAQIQKLVGQLDREAQKVILKQAKMMLPHHTEPPKRSKAA